MDKQKFIKKQSVFSKLSETEIEKLSELFNEVTFTPGEVVVKEGDTVDSVYLIISGQANVQRDIVKNNAIQTESLAVLRDGDAIGLNDRGFYSLSGKRTATVVAITDLNTLCLSMAEFHGFSLAYPHVNEIMRQNAACITILL